MSYAAVPSYSPYSGDVASSHNLSLPLGTVAGSKLLILAGESVRYGIVIAFYRDATQAEVDQGYLVYSPPEATAVAAFVFRITGASGFAATPDEANNSANPDPPISYSEGDTVWFSVVTWRGDIAHSAYSTNYSDNQHTVRFSDATDGVGIAVCSRNLNASSEDPGAHTLASATDWGAITVVISSAMEGAATATEGPDTGSGNGTITITGTGGATEGPDTGSGNGTITVTGNGSASEGPDTANGSGNITVTGSGSAAEGPDTGSGNGQISITGTATASGGNDTAVASGSISITGSGSATEGPDTANGTGTIDGQNIGHGVATESGDTATASGSISIVGPGSATESHDTASGTSSISLVGSGAATEGSDTASATGSIGGAAHASATENPDSASAVGSISIIGEGNATEARDTATASGSIAIIGSGNATEARDTASGIGVINDQNIGHGNATESRDTASGSGSISVVGSASATSGNDTASGSGSIDQPATGNAAATSGNDTATAVGSLSMLGVVAVTESPAIARGVGRGVMRHAGSMAIVRAGDGIAGNTACCCCSPWNWDWSVTLNMIGSGSPNCVNYSGTYLHPRDSFIEGVGGEWISEFNVGLDWAVGFPVYSWLRLAPPTFGTSEKYKLSYRLYFVVGSVFYIFIQDDHGSDECEPAPGPVNSTRSSPCSLLATAEFAAVM